MKKIDWRYARGIPDPVESRVFLADSSRGVSGATRFTRRVSPAGAHLLFTSPPYLGVTNYHYDQWLRLWLMGGPDRPRSMRDKHRGKFEHPECYRELLRRFFSNAARLLADDATIYVRTDRRERTAKVTREVFPSHTMRSRIRPLEGVNQTRLFGNADQRLGEVDLILKR